MILVSYDGSADADEAIDHAALLMPGARATVLTVWEPFLETMARTGAMGAGAGFGGFYADDPAIDAATAKRAAGTAAAGAARATAAGLDAESRAVGSHGGLAEAILAAAADIDAALVVLGTRGLGGVRSFLMGSTSHEVVQHADRPVLVVPSPHLAEQRRGWARWDDVAATPV